MNKTSHFLKPPKNNTPLFHWVGMGIVFTFGVFYYLALAVFLPRYGEGVTIFVVLPVAVAGWIFGKKIGVWVGVFSFPINLLLLALANRGQFDRAMSLRWAIEIDFFLAVAAGFTSGYAGEIIQKKDKNQDWESFLTAMEAVPHGMLIADSNGKISLANKQAENIFGYEASGLQGIGIEQLVPEPIRHHHTFHRSDYLNHPHPRQMEGRELTAIRRDGSTFPIQVGLNPIWNNGQISILVSAMDMSLQKQAEAQRQSLMEIMQAAVETNNLQEYLAKVHAALKKALSAENYFVILKNKTTGMYEGAYSVDQINAALAPQSEMQKSASAYVIRTGKSLLLTEERFQQLIAEGEMELIGSRSLSWLGAPLKISGESIGVMVVQDYEKEFCYSKAEEEFFTSTAGQVALAVERKRAEEELRASQQHFYELFENVPVGIWESDFTSTREYLNELSDAGVTDFAAYFDAHPEAVNECVSRIKILNVNQAALQFYGVEDKSKLIDKSTTPIRIDSKSFRVFKEQFIALINGKVSYDTEFEALNMRGEIRTVTMWLRLAYGAEQTWKRVFVVFSDITERKLAEQAIQTAEFRYRQIMEQIPAVVYSAGLGPDMRWKFVSPQIKDLTGYTAEEWIADQQIWQRSLHPGDRQLVTDVETRSIITGEPVKLEYRLYTRDGRMIWVRDLATVASDENGNPFLSLGFMFDITEQKLAEEQVRRRADEFALLYDTAHSLAKSQADLRSVLQVIAARAESMLDSNSAGFYLYDATREQLDLAVRIGEMFPAGPVRLKPGQGVSGLVVQTRKTIIVNEYSTWENRSPLFDGLNVKAVLGVPMVYGGEMIGVLTIGELGSSHRKYTDADARLLELFASQAAAAIYNARLLENTIRRLDELETIARVSGTLRAANSLEEMIPGLLDETLKALDTNAGSIYLYDPASGTLQSYIQRGWFGEKMPHSQRPAEGIAGFVYSSGEVYHLKESMQEWKEIPNGWDAVCIPIQTSQEVVGVLFVSVQMPRELSSEEVRLLTTLAEIAGNAIHRTRLHEQTKRNLTHISILRQIDQTIASNFDLSVSINMLINNALTQLQADAVSILRLRPATQMLEYFAGHGFKNEGMIRQVRLRLGDKHAGQAALERRQVSITNLSNSDQFFSNSDFARLENIRAYHANPLIAKGEVKGVLEVFHREPFHPDKEWLELMDTLAGQAALAIDNAELFNNLQRSNQDLKFAYDTTIEGWSRALDLRDRETEGHTQRVTEMTMLLASSMGLQADELVHVHRGALLHDIGKMGVPDQILLKPGRLTIKEWKIMRMHPVYAYEMLQPIAYLRPALEIPYAHHERWDGSGYPRALKGEEIPLAARIFSVVDVWDALLSNRPYRRAWKQQRVVEYMETYSGKYFDPKVVNSFLTLMSK
ncbi:MAG TPA: GAF domain-containing protein [Anaerolineales bacterium]|nr:GAF domain-containing protein [Anaerolineales bacterium]